MKSITILGSTGSIGMNTLDVISRHVDRYRVFALTANTDVETMFAQCLRHEPEFAVMTDHASAKVLEQLLVGRDMNIAVLCGLDGLFTVVEHEDVDYVMAAIVGAAGLLPALGAARKGKRILLANKESLVMSGKLFMDTVCQSSAELLPIDSEHNAIFQCLPFDFQQGLTNIGVRKILLTASGGPFRDWSLEHMAVVTPDQACAHPNWVMGKKISVDSATMMNKGLELIEACWLFNIDPKCVEVVVHPQSVVHSLVEYQDGSMLAQLGNPDMRTAIAHGLAWPERIDAGVASLNLFDIGQLNFERPDETKFPCLRLARLVIQEGGTCAAILNAANEIAVHEFLQKKIRFTDIARVIDTVLDKMEKTEADSLDVILEVDRMAREHAARAIRRIVL